MTKYIPSQVKKIYALRLYQFLLDPMNMCRDTLSIFILLDTSKSESRIIFNLIEFDDIEILNEIRMSRVDLLSRLIITKKSNM